MEDICIVYVYSMICYGLILHALFVEWCHTLGLHLVIYRSFV